MTLFPSLEHVLGLNWFGDWTPDHIYFQNDAVIYNNKIYVVTAAETVALPTDKGSWVLYRNHPVSQELSAGLPSPTPFTPPPPVSEWTWANQGTAVAYDDPAGIKFVIEPDDTGQICAFILGDLPNVPYTITTAIPTPLGFVSNALRIILLDDVSGKFKGIQGSTITYWDDPVTLNSFPTIDNNVDSAGGLATAAFWVRVQDDGSNLVVSVSTDGLFFQVWAVVPRTDVVIPTKYGIGMTGQVAVSGYPQITQAYLLSFEITTP